MGFRIYLIGLMFVLSACLPQQKSDGGSSKITLIIPDWSATLPSQKNASSFESLYYAVNILGPELPTSSASCQPTKGISSNFVSPGESISLEVPKGKDRLIEVYASTTPIWNSDPTELYKIGSTLVDLVKDTETVDIDIELPKEQISVAHLFNLPAHCAPPVVGFVEAEQSVLFGTAPISVPLSLSTPLDKDLKLTWSMISNLEQEPSIFFLEPMPQAQNLQIKFQIRTISSGNWNCVMYEEAQQFDTTQGFSGALLNDGTGIRGADSGVILAQVFGQSEIIPGCDTGAWRLFVYYRTESDSSWLTWGDRMVDPRVGTLTIPKGITDIPLRVFGAMPGQAITVNLTGAMGLSQAGIKLGQSSHTIFVEE